MTNPVGRTVGKFFKLQLSDSAAVLRDLEVDTLGGVGLVYPQIDVSALQDALKGFLPGTPDASLTLSGPWSNKAAVAASGTGAAPTTTGCHSILPGVVGLFTPLTVAVYIGVQEYWTTGDPAWGIAHTAANGVLLFDYTVDVANMKYSATLKFFPGSAAPAWGTAALA
jgi:hypothetical protein